MVQTATIAPGRSTSDPEQVLVEAEPQISRSEADLGRRRFTIAMVAGTAIVMIPMLWLLWDMWAGTLNPLRGVPYDNFYDLQARAIFHGHLYLPAGKMGIEAFVHGGRSYTYFGLFPSLIRMPILLVTSSFDGQLTAPSILLAWLCTSFFSSLMLWRVRILMRGEVAARQSRGSVLRNTDGHHHGRVGDPLSGCDAFHLQRRLRLECSSDRWQPFRTTWRAGTADEGSGHP